MDLQSSVMLQQQQQQHTSASSVAATVHNIAHTQNVHQAGALHVSSLSIPETHPQLSWSCELCGRMFSTRDEWTVHAKSHLEVYIALIFHR